MADSDSSGDQWLEAQRRYWDAWMDMTRRGLETANVGQKAPANPWAEGMEQWWKAVAPGTPQPAQGLLGQMVNLGKSYFSMAEGLTKTGSATDTSQVVENWMRMMSDAFGKSSQGMNPFAAVAGQRGREGMAFWDLPFDNLARTFSAGLPVPGDFMKALEHPSDARAQLDRFLSAPAIGYGRESQEQFQKFGRLMLDYENAMSDYQAGFGDLGSRSMAAFRTRLEARAKDSGAVNSVREVFDIWVDACEEVYAEYAMSDEYARRYGRMVNALMAVKRQGAQLVDEWLETMNMPTRTDLSAVQRRLHDTRADYQKLRVFTETLRAEMDALNGAGSELQALRAEVAELRKQLKSLSPAAPAKSEKAATDTDAGAGEKSPDAPAKAAPKRARTTGAPRKTGTTRRKTQS